MITSLSKTYHLSRHSTRVPPQAEVASGISILGTDCNSNMAWSAKERYVARNFGFLGLERGEHTVDGRNPANQLRLIDLIVYPVICRVLYIEKVVVWDF